MQAYVLLRARVFMCTAMLRKGHGVYAARIASKYIRIFVFVFALSGGPRPALFRARLRPFGFCVFSPLALAPPRKGGGRAGFIYNRISAR